MRTLVLIITMIMITSGVKGQPVLPRLLARSVRSCDSAYGLHLKDSSTYRYSTGRGSDMRAGIYLYDSMVNYMSNSGIMQPRQLYYRNYGDSDRVLIHNYATAVGNGWQNAGRTIYTYFSDTRYDSTVNETWDATVGNWVGTGRHKYFYTGIRLDSSHWRSYVSGQWRLDAKEINGYAGNDLVWHHILAWDDVSRSWDTVASDRYTYSVANGRLIEHIAYSYNGIRSMLEPLSKEQFSYDGKGRTTERTSSYWGNLTQRWEGADQYFYSYTLNDRVDVEAENQWDVVAQAWGPYKRHQYSYNAAGDITSILGRVYNGLTYVNTSLQNRNYDTNGQPLTQIFFSWDENSSKWLPLLGDNSMVSFYYEPDPTGVIRSPVGNNNVSIYPNPATRSVHIELQWKELRPFTISIYDMQGRQVYHVTEVAALTAVRKIALDDIHAGIYIVKAANGSEEMTKQLIIGDQ